MDATWYGASVPLTHTPRFAVDSDVHVVTPNTLPRALETGKPPRRFVILGAGKTALNVGVWLSGMGVPAGRIGWVMPRDSWLLNRLGTQPGAEFFHEALGRQAGQMDAFAAATDAHDLFDWLEAAGLMLRIDRTVQPTMFHYATLPEGEVGELRTITDVIRTGHVRRVSSDRLVLADGEMPLPADTLHIDCTASAVDAKSTRHSVAAA